MDYKEQLNLKSETNHRSSTKSSTTEYIVTQVEFSARFLKVFFPFEI